MYLYHPNGGATVMHLADYNRLGAVVGALCGEREFSRSCNLPLGQPVCSRCREAAAGIERWALPQYAAGRLLGLCIGMMTDGFLSEGQVAKASGLDRVAIRSLAHEMRQMQALKQATDEATQQ